MTDPIIERRVPDGEDFLTVTARYDSRLKKTVRWTVQNGLVEIRAPRHIGKRELNRIVDEIVEKVRKQRRRARNQNDDNLQQRAETINRQYFESALQWHTIRWVTNMHKRLGSCTSGGPTDGDIRISTRITNWPQYVVDYVIAHELAHRKYANHSKAFWAYLARYPHTERARGFIEGIAYAENGDADALL
ncbi:MAG: M48 family metallopeptidase [Anaerolineae bacterium]|nr:M48 family metallopeptidase [Anaerolineae bacterium]